MNKRGTTDIESNVEIPSAQSESFQIQLRDSKVSTIRYNCQSMYKAVVDGNLEAAKKLLKRDPSLACHQQITEAGDRALHVAAYKGKKNLVRDLVDSVNDPSDLELQDGHGYSACCYVASTDAVEVADILLKKNSSLCTKQNRNHTTPLEIAVLYGNKEWALKYITTTQIYDLSEQDWFKLLLAAVHGKMYGVALEILEKNGSLAVRKGEYQQTALHVVAQIDISLGSRNRDFPKMKPSLHKLANKLWGEIQKLAKGDMLELMKNPSILHNAAKFGNVELISMFSSKYPELLGHTNDEGHSVFHIAVMYQQQSMLELIKKKENCLRYNALSEDIYGNNILHLAAKLQPPGGMMKIACDPDVRIRKRHSWFKEVEKIVPRFFVDKKNKEGYTPIEVFWDEHKNMLEETAKHLKSTPECGMLISTVILTVVFAATFAPPGGYHEANGKPLLKALSPNPNEGKDVSSWFTIFVVCNILALFSSTCSILMFWSILSSIYKKEQLLNSHKYLKFGLAALLASLMSVISIIFSVFYFMLPLDDENLFTSIIIPSSSYMLVIMIISYKYFKILPGVSRMRKKILNTFRGRTGQAKQPYSLDQCICTYWMD